MNLSDLISSLNIVEIQGEIDHVHIHDVQMDSRHIQNGDLFVCIHGFTVDGHQFVPQAVKNGAVAILSERTLNVSVPVIVVSDTSRALAKIAARFYHYPTNDISLIGVTGTNGKTTVTYLLEEIFKHHGHQTGLIGTIQMKIGDQSYPLKNTTPDALFLQKSFAQMKQANVETAMMEVSSHALDLGRVHGCDFDVAVFTNLSQDHLDYHETMENYAYTKSLLFAQLGNAYDGKKHKFAIINADDPACALMKKATSQHVLTYGCDREAHVMAKNIRSEVTATSFTLVTPKGTLDIKSPLIGMFNVYNMLAASSAAIALNVPLRTIKEALENIPGVPGRFEPVQVGQPYGVIVDYAHTPDSLKNVLQTIKSFPHQRVYVVVGCGGDRDRKKRPQMAQIACQYADYAIFTSDNPRTEDPANILADMTHGLHTSTPFDTIEDRKEAIEHAVHMADTGDIILIAGKGHETYQEINHVRFDFDDREVAKQAILEKERS